MDKKKADLLEGRLEFNVLPSVPEEKEEEEDSRDAPLPGTLEPQGRTKEQHWEGQGRRRKKEEKAEKGEAEEEDVGLAVCEESPLP